MTAEAAHAGVDLIHIREPRLHARDLCTLTSAVVAATRDTGARVVVSGRPDIALAARAHGVHLPARGAPTDRVRELSGRDWLIGRSSHAAHEIAAETTADYLVFGTVFATASKPGVVGQGLGALARAAAQTTAPVLAIGGITVDRVRACREAGAAGVAAISLFVDPWARGEGVAGVVQQLRRLLDAD